MKKQIIAGLAAAMIGVGAIGGTFAYLTSGPQAVTNTFTVGAGVKITLDEAKVTELGEVDGTERVYANEYKLIPGHTYKKDPTINVASDSDECYVFVHVENGITELEDETNTIASQLEEYEWKAVNGKTGYYYKENKYTAGSKVVVFDDFTIDSEETQATLQNYATAQIKITACAVQTDGFKAAVDAVVALPDNF